jgi:hypothetical protein
MNKDIKQELYRIVDHFLTEAKNQNGEERSLDRLNADRHLAVENLEALFIKQQEEFVKKVENLPKQYSGYTTLEITKNNESVKDNHYKVYESDLNNLIADIKSKLIK